MEFLFIDALKNCTQYKMMNEIEVRTAILDTIKGMKSFVTYI